MYYIIAIKLTVQSFQVSCENLQHWPLWKQIFLDNKATKELQDAKLHKLIS